jgi:hypothetical protein
LQNEISEQTIVLTTCSKLCICALGAGQERQGVGNTQTQRQEKLTENGRMAAHGPPAMRVLQTQDPATYVVRRLSAASEKINDCESVRSIQHHPRRISLAIAMLLYCICASRPLVSVNCYEARNLTLHSSQRLIRRALRRLHTIRRCGPALAHDLLHNALANEVAVALASLQAAHALLHKPLRKSSCWCNWSCHGFKPVAGLAAC